MYHSLDANKSYSIFSLFVHFGAIFSEHPVLCTPTEPLLQANCASLTMFHCCAVVINQESRGMLQCYPRLAGILEQQLIEPCQWKKALSAQNIQWVTALKWQQPRCKIRGANATTTKTITIRKLPIKGHTMAHCKKHAAWRSTRLACMSLILCGK